MSPTGVINMQTVLGRDPTIASDFREHPVARALHALPWSVATTASVLGVSVSKVLDYRERPSMTPINSMRVLEMVCGAVGKSTASALLLVIAERLLEEIGRQELSAGAQPTPAYQRLQAEAAMLEAQRGSHKTPAVYRVMLRTLGALP
jgi:hypothetical protein